MGESGGFNDDNIDSGKLINPLLINIKEEPVDEYTNNETNLLQDDTSTTGNTVDLPITVKQEEETNEGSKNTNGNQKQQPLILLVDASKFQINHETMTIYQNAGPNRNLKSPLYIPLSIPRPQIHGTAINSANNPLNILVVQQKHGNTTSSTQNYTMPPISNPETEPHSSGITQNLDEDKKLPLEELEKNQNITPGTSDIDNDIVKPEVDIKEEYDEDVKYFPQDLLDGENDSLESSSRSPTDLDDSTKYSQEGRNSPVVLTKHTTKRLKREPKRTRKCRVCNFAATCSYHVTAHVAEVHTAENNFRCLLCKTTVENHPTFNHLEHHVATIHRQQLRWQCHKCGKSFRSQAILKKHKNTEINSFRPYACHLCTYTCKSEKALESHMVTHGTFMICPYCTKPLKKTNYERHLITHTGDSTYWCKICDFKGFTKYELSKHYKKTKHDKPHLCPICKRGFLKEESVKRHIEVEHSGRNVRFTCEYDGCTQEFTSNYYYGCHKKVHELPDDQILRCSNEGCTFITNAPRMLMGHYTKTKHHRPFLCTFCPNRFTLKSSMERHILNQHTAGEKDTPEPQGYNTGYYLDEEDEIDEDKARVANFGMLWLGMSHVDETNGEVSTVQNSGENPT